MKIPNINLTYEEVEKRHPVELQKLIAKLRRSKGKQKDSDAYSITFEYGYAMRCEGFTGTDVLNHISGVKPLPTKTELKTVAEKVQDWMSRVTPVQLSAKIGRWCGSEKVPNPPELEKWFIECAEKEIAEKAKRDAMTPVEKEEHRQQLIRELSGMGGFSVIRF